MHPTKTYELIIDFPSSRHQEETKNRVKDWLVGRGEDTFVEGIVENIDLDFDYAAPDTDYYGNLGGDITPLIIYRYDHEYLMQLQALLKQDFKDSLKLSMNELETHDWMEGWKSSFKPFSTKNFLVCPPWETLEPEDHKHLLVIEPGMAFGTGQHETTQLCLKLIETHFNPEASPSALDVGTGTGILAIALKKLGCKSVWATDIDADAMIAAKENAGLNEVSFELSQDSVPSDLKAHMVIANILLVVIRRIFKELVGAMEQGGFLVISGVLEEEFDDLQPLLDEYGLKIADKAVSGGWAALLLRSE